jgi:L-aminopeptidase/D-esterase-like protein
MVIALGESVFIEARRKVMKKPRARDLLIPFEGRTGPYNAITDVPGLSVGHATVVEGEGGACPVHTGVSAVWPRGDKYDPVFSAWFSLNGCGEITGTTWIEESGLLYGPVLLTNTFAVGTVYEAVNVWVRANTPLLFVLPVVAETFDGVLNDIHSNYIRPEHVFSALESAASGPMAEGNVGGGTGMISHGFKGGIGTSSRVLDEADGGYTLGVMVQANHGLRKNLTIAGVPVGQELMDWAPNISSMDEGTLSSSIIVLVATDCPLLPHQLTRLAKRVPLGIGRVGGMGENFSGDIFLAISTAPFGTERALGIRQIDLFPNQRMNPLIAATIQATEEAILNALVAAETMTGCNSNTVFALPQDRLKEILQRHNRLNE